MRRIKGEFVFSLLLLFIFGAALNMSMDWPMKARVFPLLITTAGIGLGLWTTLLSGIKKQAPRKEKKRKPPTVKESKTKVTPRSEGIIILWVLAFMGLILLLGFWIGIALFVLIFLLVFGRESWKTAVIFAVGMWVVIFGIFHLGLKIPLYGGIFELAFL